MRNVPRGVTEATSEASGGRNRHTQCCSKVGLKRGPWTPEEDALLADYVRREGEGRWRTLPKKAGLLRCGKSCRLRWVNYLRPAVKRGQIAPDEEEMILRLHRLLGNRWSLIAGRIPGRTDNEIKNYWNTHLSKKLISRGIDPRTHKPLQDAITAAAPPPPPNPNPNPNSFSVNSYGQHPNSLSGNNFMHAPFPYTPVSSIPLEYHTAADETLHRHHHYMPHGHDHGLSNQETMMATKVDGDRAQKIDQVVNHRTAAHETLHCLHHYMPHGHDHGPSNKETMMAMTVGGDRAQKIDQVVNHGHDDDDDVFSSFLNSLINEDEYVYNSKALDTRSSTDGDKGTGNHFLCNQFHAPFGTTICRGDMM